MKKQKILHITPHLGGGVGRVILNYFSRVCKNDSVVHSIVCLDYANDNAVASAKKNNFRLYGNMAGQKTRLLRMTAAADIVLVHWWNHPLLYDLLVRSVLPPCRLVMWSHSSGMYQPNVFTEKILNYPDMFVFTTPMSFKTKEIEGYRGKNKNSLRSIWSTGGVENAATLRRMPHKGFNVGYLGTVDYAKLHPDFLKICAKINIPDAKFIVCGGPKEKDILEDAKKMGIAGKFNFTGLVEETEKYLSIFDVFGYPLAPYHYGTCDQSLQESMAAGIVPVVISNPMESFMVENGVTGIAVKDENEYVLSIEKLYINASFRDYLSRNARDYALRTFSLDSMVTEWDSTFAEILAFSKKERAWKHEKSIVELLPRDVFLESLGKYAEDFEVYCRASSDSEKERSAAKIREKSLSYAWRSETKGTVHQYHSFFPEDEVLSFWSNIMTAGIQVLH